MCRGRASAREHDKRPRLIEWKRAARVRTVDGKHTHTHSHLSHGKKCRNREENEKTKQDDFRRLHFAAGAVLLLFFVHSHHLSASPYVLSGFRKHWCLHACSLSVQPAPCSEHECCCCCRKRDLIHQRYLCWLARGMRFSQAPAIPASRVQCGVCVRYTLRCTKYIQSQ